MPNVGRLYYEELGTGFPLVLLHGHTLDRRAWAGAASDLAAAGYRVILPDMAGHGLSAPPPPGSTPAEDLADLLRSLGVARAAVAGLSLGGAVAINFALRFPDLCAALVPVDSALFGYRFAAWTSTRPYITIARTEGLAAGLAAWLKDPLFATAMADPAMAAAVTEMVMAFPGHDWLNKAPSPVPPGILDAEHLDDVTAPTLVLSGELDLPDFQQIAAKLAAEIPGARHATVTGAGHLLPMEAPAAFLGALLPFLDPLGMGRSG
jgi:pimeloyl-ACP methyl ester carboxylesterase